MLRKSNAIVNTRRLFHSTLLVKQQQQQSNFNGFETSLEWKESVLADGTIFYRHPSSEQVLAVKQTRFAFLKAVQKTERKLLATPAGSKPLTKDVLEQKKQAIAEQVKQQIVSKQQILTPEQIQQVKQLRKEDSYTHSSQKLAKQFKVKPQFITQVSKEAEAKARDDLHKLKIRNQNRPQRSTSNKFNKL